MPASSLPDQLMIEVSEANSARRYPASLVHADFTSNVALVKIDDEELLARTKPLEIGEPITIDDEFEIWQLGASELLERYTGRVLKVAPSSTKLMLTVKTNLADGGNGQIALKDGKVVGIVVSTYSSRQEGRLLSVETIRQYLADYEDGEYTGFGSPGLWTLRLLRDDLRAHYLVPDDAHGILVSNIVPGRTGHGVLKAGDVITHLAGHDLDDEGMYTHPRHGRLSVSYLTLGSVHPGDDIPAKILREGKEMEVKVPVRSWPREEQVVPYNYYNRRPPYMVVGGLVVLELVQRSGGSAKLREYQQNAFWDPPTDRKRVIYASRVLDDTANKGLDDIAGASILTVNGKRIAEMKDVAEALKTPLGEHHVFVFEGLQKPFVIKAAELEEINERIAKTYKIPELSYLE
jgi:hypothetical protein